MATIRSTLVSKNVVVAGHRTSMRLEPEMWEALREIARREGESIHRICTRVDAARTQSSLTAAVRVFALAYFRAMAAGPVPPDGGQPGPA